MYLETSNISHQIKFNVHVLDGKLLNYYSPPGKADVMDKVGHEAQIISCDLTVIPTYTESNSKTTNGTKNTQRKSLKLKCGS